MRGQPVDALFLGALPAHVVASTLAGHGASRRSAFFDLIPSELSSIRSPSCASSHGPSELAVERKRLIGARKGQLQPSRWRSGADWLEYIEEPPASLSSTDLLSSKWVANPCKGQCSKNVTRPWAPFWHPHFTFNQRIRAVRIQLSKEGKHEKPFWDVIFDGRPGGPNDVPNNATPAGGKLPLFPEFCPPLSKKDVFVLHLEHLPSPADNPVPLFDEDVRLRVKSDIPLNPSREAASCGKQDRLQQIEAALGPPPRPALVGPDGPYSFDTNGEPLFSENKKEELDPETGLAMGSDRDITRLVDKQKRDIQELLHASVGSHDENRTLIGIRTASCGTDMAISFVNHTSVTTTKYEDLKMKHRSASARHGSRAICFL